MFLLVTNEWMDGEKEIGLHLCVGGSTKTERNEEDGEEEEEE